ncbi:chemotaxis protein CheW [Desulfuromonas sp. AOP6]|uniref:chemotaxis protein CheW n=1 Tax=Desulfuromonas sp. AOP6 TaxID=1566351 RepID=UPI001278C021|nr:chemotaxis protein CheW [Desulfuromonas sp. AOP6]BCA81042.1 chemotaxis protein CheW [Desulfuromonas sp. AOP6]
MSEGNYEQILTFALCGRLYGVEVARIQEVVKAPEFYFIPRAGFPYAGAINFHGKVVPVLDLPAMIDPASKRRDKRVVVLHPDLCVLGFRVESIDGLVLLEADTIPGDKASGEEETYIRCRVDHENRELCLLDVEKLVSTLGESREPDRRKSWG